MDSDRCAVLQQRGARTSSAHSSTTMMARQARGRHQFRQVRGNLDFQFFTANVLWVEPQKTTEATMTRKTRVALSLGLLLLAAVGAGAQTAATAKKSATPASAAAKPTIVLVHGAFADASSF